MCIAEETSHRVSAVKEDLILEKNADWVFGNEIESEIFLTKVYTIPFLLQDIS